MKKAFLFLIILFAKLTIAQNTEILMFDMEIVAITPVNSPAIKPTTKITTKTKTKSTKPVVKTKVKPKKK